jgi:hypothetical protein
LGKVGPFFEFNEKFLRPLLRLGGHVERRRFGSNVASQANSIIASLHYPSSGAPILFVVAFWWHRGIQGLIKKFLPLPQ